jgi:hypothetical protein
MASVTVEIQGLDELIGRITATRDRVSEMVLPAVAQTLEDVKAVGDPLTPYRTGFLRSRNQTRIVESNADQVMGEYYNDCDYAPPVLFGHHTRSGSWVAGRDWMTPALLYGRSMLTQRLAEVSLV